MKDGETKDLRNVSPLEREKIRREYNSKAFNLWFYSMTGSKDQRTVMVAEDNYRVRYHGQVFGNYLVVSEYHYRHNKTNFLRYFNFV